MTPPPTTVVLVEDHWTVAEALALAFERDGRFSVIDIVPDATLAYDRIRALNPKLVIADIEQPGRSVFDMIDAMRAQGCDAKFAILSAYSTEAFVDRALRTNVDGYLLKTERFTALCALLERIIHGEKVYSAAIEKMLERGPDGALRLVRMTALSELTDRQIEVLRELALGYSVKEIAKRMQISAKTVDSHKYRVMKALDIHDRLDLAKYAREAGLIAE